VELRFIRCQDIGVVFKNKINEVVEIVKVVSNRQGSRDVVYLIERIKKPIRLSDAVNFVAQDDIAYKSLPNVREKIDYIPQKTFIIPVDSVNVIENGTVHPDKVPYMVDEVSWNLNRNYITKNHLMVLDMLATNTWQRPFYYAITVSSDNYLNLNDYFELHGLAYRIVPAVDKDNAYYIGSVNADVMYDNLMHTFKWGNVNDPDVYIDENIDRMLTNVRNNFGVLSTVLINQSKPDSALQVIERCLEVVPENKVPFGYSMIPIAENLFKLGEEEDAITIVEAIRDNTIQDLEYYTSLQGRFANYLGYEKQLALEVMRELSRVTKQYGEERMSIELDQQFQRYGYELNLVSR
jgi:hypothetical protein